MGKKSAINYQLLMENSADVICLVGLDFEMSYASPSCGEILGWTAEEMCAGWPNRIVSQEDMPTLKAACQQGIATEPMTVKMFKKDGSFAWMEVSARVVKASESDVEGVVLTLRDVTARRDREEQLEMLSQVDGLTGLGNRRSFDQGLDNEWRRAFREHTELSLLLIDIDFFKTLNDHAGHPAGDACLRIVADEIRRTFHRASDLVARYGGEEFAVILPNTCASGARLQADKIREHIQGLRIEHPGRPDNQPWVTVSIGVGTAIGGDHRNVPSSHALLQFVDDALYSAKSHGRNRVWAATPGKVRREFSARRESYARETLGLGLDQKESLRRSDTVN